METYLLTKEQRDALLAYLQTKPYMEVAGAMAFLSTLQSLDEYLDNLNKPQKQAK